MLLKGIALLALVLAALVFFVAGTPVWSLPLLFLGFDLGLLLLSVLFLWICCATVDMSKPQEEDSRFFRRLMHPYIEALISIVGIRLHTQGLEKVPTDGRFLLVCNHLFIADPGVLLHCFKNSQLAFVTKQENDSVFLVGKIMHKILCQPIDRNNDRAALKTILKCIQLLKEDKVSVCVFPEGYTSKDGKLHHFRNGVFKIAQKANVPIVVCTLQNTRQIFKNMARLKHTDVPVHLVEVIPAEELKGLTTVQIGERVYEAMITDLGEEFRFQEPAADTEA